MRLFLYTSSPPLPRSQLYQQDLYTNKEGTTDKHLPTMPTPVNTDQILKDVNILGRLDDQRRQVLSKEAIIFLAVLHRTFNATRKTLLERRQVRQQELDNGHQLDFLPETKHIRDNKTWRAAPPAPGMADRRLEITGPVDRKMVVNALNSDVWTYMADFEGISAHARSV